MRFRKAINMPALVLAVCSAAPWAVPMYRAWGSSCLFLQEKQKMCQAGGMWLWLGTSSLAAGLTAGLKASLKSGLHGKMLAF